MTETDVNGNSDRFLGLTKVQFGVVATLLTAVVVGVLVINLALGISSNGARIKEIELLATAAALQAERLDALTQELRLSQCAQKENVTKQIAATEKFLLEHPGPEPIQGITRRELLDGLERQRAFRDTFENVDCDLGR